MASRERGRSFGAGVPTPFVPEPEDAGAVEPAHRRGALPTIIPSGYVPIVPLRASGTILEPDGSRSMLRLRIFGAALTVEGEAVYLGVDASSGETILAGQDRVRVYLEAGLGDVVDPLLSLAQSARTRP